MKKIWILALIMFSTTVMSFAAEKKVEAPADCKYFGMDRTVHAQSRMVVRYADGSSTGTCSLNCVVIDMRETKDKTVVSYQVGDYLTRRLIDAKTAVWVMGGKKKGVMTSVAKWAFADQGDADAFIKANGGKLATFDEAIKAAVKELADSGHPKKMHGRQ